MVKGATSEAGKYLFRSAMCGGGVRSILLSPLVSRFLETIDVCIWRMFVFMSVVVTVWVYVGMFDVYRPLLKILYLALEY